MIATPTPAVMRRRHTLLALFSGLVGAAWACALRPNTEAASAKPTSSHEQPIRARWLARRAADSACATLPFVRTIPGQTEWNIHRDPTTGRECYLGSAPDALAYVLDGRLHCPPPEVWKRAMPPDEILALRPGEISAVEVRTDSVSRKLWSCPGRVDRIIMVTTERGP